MNGFTNFWGVASVLLPLYVRVDGVNDVRICRNYLFIFIVFLSISLFKNGKLKLQDYLPWVGLLVLAWFNIDYLYQPATLEQFATLGAFCIAVPHLVSNYENMKINLFLNYFRASVLIQSVLVFTNMFGINLYNLDVPVPRALGSFGQETLTAAFIAVLLPTFFNKKWAPLLPIPLMAIFFTGSAMSAISVVAASVFFVAFSCLKLKKALLSLLGFYLMTFAFVTGFIGVDGYFNDNERFKVWETIYGVIKDRGFWHILFGSGVGSFWHHFSDYCTDCNQRFLYAHSEPLQLVYEFGLAGVIMIGLVLKRIFYLPSTIPNKGIILAMMIAAFSNALGNFTFHIVPISMVILIGYTYLIGYKEKHYGYYINQDGRIS